MTVDQGDITKFLMRQLNTSTAQMGPCYRKSHSLKSDGRQGIYNRGGRFVSTASSGLLPLNLPATPEKGSVLGSAWWGRKLSPIARNRLNAAIEKVLRRLPPATRQVLKEQPQLSPVELVEKLIATRNMAALREIARVLAEVPGFSVKVAQQPASWTRRGDTHREWQRRQTRCR